MNAKTLPAWATQNALPANQLDPMRELIRKTPDLKALGGHVGAARVYTEAEFGVILAAFKKWQKERVKGARRKKAAPAAA